MATVGVSFGDYKKEELTFPEDKGKENYTFGVFTDGTLNNMKNTLARLEYMKKQNHESYDKELADLYEKLKSEDSSYENDLSNPAILYKYYKKQEGAKIFSVYVEGIGTENYKSDSTLGYGLGQGETGILAKVRKAVEQVVAKLTDEKIGRITIDVFGFSRGAAAARNLVYEITLPPQRPNSITNSETGETKYTDHNGYDVTEQDIKNGYLPKGGHMGILLARKKIEVETLLIRFAGLFDTVAHHGMKQSNDIADLGLNAIDVARTVVHFCAADEHRTNFSLDVIPAGKNRIEKFLPGVHCDVGGSYVEGQSEKKERIDAEYTDTNLNIKRSKLIREGWFKPSEISVVDQGKFQKYVLKSNRSKVSNNYSFIPLHFMCELAMLKQKVPLLDTQLMHKYKFLASHQEFLEGIKKRLREYVFNNSPKFEYIPTLPFKKVTAPKPQQQFGYNDPMKIDNTIATIKMPIADFKAEKELEELNKDIRKLRNEYLHWNADYSGAIAAHKPNSDGKRTVYSK
jgi:hypothetical protein